MSEIAEASIKYDGANRNWNTQFSRSNSIKPIITYGGKNKYECTVENFASSVIVHEWFSHGVQHVSDEQNNHLKAYFNVIYNNSLWEKTTDNYKKFIKNKFIEYLRHDVEFYQRKQ